MWSPDGRYIYFASRRGGTLNIWGIGADRGRSEQITASEGDDTKLDGSADGKKIVFSTWRLNNIVQRDLAARGDQQAATVLTTDAGRHHIGPVYSPDGKRLAYFSNLKGAENESIWATRTVQMRYNWFATI